jgi:hypothetical protein
LAIVVVGGSAKDIGKTALVCGVIAALPEFDWTAVKITGHDYDFGSISQSSVVTETTAGQETDTARYLAAGARRALLVRRCGPDVPMGEIRVALEGACNILFESNRIMDVVKPDVCLALVGGSGTELKPSFLGLLRKADALVSVGSIEMESAELAVDIPRFELESLDHLTPELVNWLRSRLSPARGFDAQG